MGEKRYAAMLKSLRERAGLSQAELARRLGINQPSLSRWESGQGEPGLSIIRPLAAALGVDIETLVNLPAPAPARKRGKK
jgi:transcriptional regulator with XRE-family HTH domain